MRETVVLRIVEKIRRVELQVIHKKALNVRNCELIIGAVKTMTERGREGVYSTQILDTTKPHNFRKNKKADCGLQNY